MMPQCTFTKGKMTDNINDAAACSSGRVRGAGGAGGELDRARGQSGPGTGRRPNHAHSPGGRLYSRSHSFKNYQVKFLPVRSSTYLLCCLDEMSYTLCCNNFFMYIWFRLCLRNEVVELRDLVQSGDRFVHMILLRHFAWLPWRDHVARSVKFPRRQPRNVTPRFVD